MSDRTIIYCDGSCIGNPGPGGWAAIILSTPERVVSGYEADTTNNRMELRAAIGALQNMPEGSTIEIRTDSKYVIRGITVWRLKWQENGWLVKSKKPIKNIDLWKQLIEVSDKHKITWQWVKGHSGNFYNTKVDKIAYQRAANG